MKKVIKPKGVSEPTGPYSHGVSANKFVFVAGQVARDASGKTVGLGDIKKQTDQALKNLELVLQSSGTGRENVLKITIYTIDMDKYLKFGKDVVAKYFGKEPPADSLIGVKRLANKDFLVEIEAIASIS